MADWRVRFRQIDNRQSDCWTGAGDVRFDHVQRSGHHQAQRSQAHAVQQGRADDFPGFAIQPESP